jgi:hypothetical protein
MAPRHKLATGPVSSNIAFTSKELFEPYYSKNSVRLSSNCLGLEHPSLFPNPAIGYLIRDLTIVIQLYTNFSINFDDIPDLFA